MKTVTTRKELTDVLEKFRLKNATLGFVPTMGALHQGHLSLIKRSKENNDFTVCSIFVNPTQFTSLTDLEHYPRPIEADIAMLTMAGADILFMPATGEMYGDNEKWNLDLGGIDSMLEGMFRPGHFQGVTQIVYKLLKLVEPDKAYFGQKDFQQLLVIKKMVEVMKLQVKIVSCPIIREADGLAMSSRNIHLTRPYHQAALLISATLFRALEDSKQYSVNETLNRALEILSLNELLTLEYFCIADAASLLPVKTWSDSKNIIALTAVNAGKTRLIDNQFLKQADFIS